MIGVGWGWRGEGCSWFPEPCISSGSSTQLAKHRAEAPDLCRVQIKVTHWTVSGLSWIRYCPQTLLRRSKKIYMSIKTTKEIHWRLYPRYQVTFFSCTSINKSWWRKTAYLKHLTGDFYSAQSALGTQTITFPPHNGLIFMAQVALGLSWMCTLLSPGFVPALEPSAILCAFLTSELKRISTGGILIRKKNYPLTQR